MENHSQLIAIFSSIFIGLITIFSVIIFSSLASCTVNNAEQNELLAPSPSELPTSALSCQELTGDDLQTCCNNWAIDNQIMTVRCVGNWEIVDGVCSFACQQSDVQ